MTPRRVLADETRDTSPSGVHLTRIGSGSRGLVTALAATVTVVAVLVAKPWASDPGSSRRAVDGAERSVATPAGHASSTTPSPEPSMGGSAVACLVRGSWRLVTFQRDGTAEQRTWYAATPLPAAAGPDDPGIPIRRAVTNPLTAIGFCAPSVKPDGAPLEVRGVRFWRREADGRAARVRGVRRLADSLGPNAARLYAYPPIVGTERHWPPGTYVIAVETTGAPWWLGIRIEELPD